MSFWYVQFSQKTNEKSRLYYYGTSSRIVFVCFLGELKTLKRHFEINWPLVTLQILLLNLLTNQIKSDCNIKEAPFNLGMWNLGFGI